MNHNNKISISTVFIFIINNRTIIILSIISALLFTTFMTLNGYEDAQHQAIMEIQLAQKVEADGSKRQIENANFLAKRINDVLFSNASLEGCDINSIKKREGIKVESLQEPLVRLSIHQPTPDQANSCINSIFNFIASSEREISKPYYLKLQSDGDYLKLQMSIQNNLLKTAESYGPSGLPTKLLIYDRIFLISDKLRKIENDKLLTSPLQISRLVTSHKSSFFKVMTKAIAIGLFLGLLLGLGTTFLWRLFSESRGGADVG